MASRRGRVSNTDLLHEIRDVGSKVDDVRLEVRGGEDQKSRDESLRGKVIWLTNEFAFLKRKVGDMEAKLKTPPIEQAARADQNAEQALMLGLGNRKGVWASIGTTIVLLLTLIARALGWIP